MAARMAVLTYFMMLVMVTILITLYLHSIVDITYPESDIDPNSDDWQHCSSIVSEEKIGFINVSNDPRLRHRYPLFLFSYGGSGNTVTRTLLEYTTNVWTGSIFSDRSLFGKGFLGEYSCTNVMVVKAHPEELSKRKGLRRKIRRRDSFLKKCLEFHHPIGSYKPIYANMSAIFIVRDFWPAMFALYQFLYGNEPSINVHIQHIMLQSFDIDWNGTSDSETSLVRHMSAATHDWTQTFKFMQLFDKYNFDYIVVKYENLVNLTHSNVAIAEMQKMLQYLYSHGYHQTMKTDLLERMQCIFNVLMKGNYGRLGTMHRKPANASIHLTFAAASKFLINNHLDAVCVAWNQIKKYALPFMYQNLQNIRCADE